MDKCTEKKIRNGRGRVNRTPKDTKEPARNEEKAKMTLRNRKRTLR